MRFRLGLTIGFGAGYVLGSKAGTQRYEQIRELWSSIVSSEPAQQATAEMRQAAERAGDRLEHRAAEGVERVTEAVGAPSEGLAGNGRIPG